MQSAKQSYENLKTSAKKRGKKFELSFESFLKIYNSTHCAYSGIEFDGVNCILSFERIDCSKGYVDGNVIAIDQYINSVRSSISTLKEFDEFVERCNSEIQKHLKKIDVIKSKWFQTETLIGIWASSHDENETPPFDFEISRKCFKNKLWVCEQTILSNKKMLSVSDHIKNGIINYIEVKNGN